MRIKDSDKDLLSDLGHDHDLFTGQIQLLDGFAEYDLRGTIRIHLPVVQDIQLVKIPPFVFSSVKTHIGRVEGLDAIFVTEPN